MEIIVRGDFYARKDELKMLFDALRKSGDTLKVVDGDAEKCVEKMKKQGGKK